MSYSPLALYIKTSERLFALMGHSKIVFPFFLIVAFALYSPVLMKSFAADDYHSIYRVATTGNLFPAGFFRPLSDLTLLINYKFFGFQSWAFNSFNIVLHAVCSFLLYVYARRATWLPAEGKTEIAFVGSLLFLVYPFHSEPIVWCVGRGASLAMIFALFSLLSIEYFDKVIFAIAFAAFFYVIGLTAYESILPLPVILLMIIWWKWRRSIIVLFSIVVFLLFTFLYFFARIKLSTVIIGSYASGIKHKSLFVVTADFLKAFCRLFIPPCDSTYLLIFLSAILAGILYLLIKLVLRKTNSTFIWRCSFFLFASLIPAAFFSLSSHTTEGDRLLYFPATFICYLLSFVCFILAKNYRFWFLLLPILIIYFLLFVELTNITWKRSSDIQLSILKQIRQINPSDQKLLYLLNIPDELDGAYIFRNGFNDALLINDIDTGGVIRINKYLWDDIMKAPPVIRPKRYGDVLSIYPHAKIYPESYNDNCWQVRVDSVDFKICSPSEIWFWNQNKLLMLK